MWREINEMSFGYSGFKASSALEALPPGAVPQVVFDNKARMLQKTKGFWKCDGCIKVFDTLSPVSLGEERTNEDDE
jgi:hypothetical protein